MAGGFTVSPVTNEQGDVVDFSLDGGNDGFRSSADDIVEFNDGSRHHVFEEASIREDGEFDAGDYYETLAQSDPRIPNALQWAAGNLPDELIAEYNQAIDNDSFDDINRILEYILEQYPEGEATEEYTEEDSEELTEEDQAVIQAVADQLAQNPPLGDDVADEWDSAAQDAANSGDATYAAIASATAAYHAGSIDAETAINWVLENHDLRDVARVYQYLNQQ